MQIQWLGVGLRVPVIFEIQKGDDRNYYDFLFKLMGGAFHTHPIGASGRDIMLEFSGQKNEQASAIAGRPIYGDVCIMTADDCRRVMK